MSWGAVAGAVIGVVGGAVQGNKNRKAAAKLAKEQAAAGTGVQTAEKQAELARQSELWAADQNRQNQLWANAINQENLDRQLGQNRLDWGREGFGSGAFDPETGNYNISLDPSQRGTLEAIRAKQPGMVAGMGGGFDVQGDVMNAYRALNQPMVQEARDRENARLAAMGMSTGSGSAWESAQRSLNDAQTRADQQAILAGFQADQSLRQSNRADLASMGQMEQGMLSGMQAPNYALAGTTAVGAPTVSSPSTPLMAGWAADQANMAANSAANTAASNANTAGWTQLLGAGAGALGDYFGGSGGGTTGGEMSTTPGYGMGDLGGGITA